MNATSILVPAIGLPGSSSMNASASSMPARSSAGTSVGEGIGSSTPTDCPGVIPKVTVGASRAPSSVTRSPYTASGSLAIPRHHCTARSNAAPWGTNSRPRRYAKVASSGLM